MYIRSSAVYKVDSIIPTYLIIRYHSEVRLAKSKHVKKMSRLAR